LTYHYCFDGNGNVGQVVDSGDGSIDARYEWDAFGKVIVAEGVYAEENSFRFSTKYYESEIGLYYFGYRFYDADLGRWLNRDPIGQYGGLNIYGYVNNNSISQIDILGLYLEKTKDPKRPEYNAHNGREAHKLISAYVDQKFNDKPVAGDLQGRKWDLIFDQPISNWLGIGFSDRRPDIINKSCPKLIWEIKPITHIKRYDWLEKDYEQIDRYLAEMPDKRYYYGEAKTFFPVSNLRLCCIKDKDEKEWNVVIVSKHNHMGLIFYKLEKKWDDSDWDNFKRELKKGPNPLLIKLMLILMGGSLGGGGVTVP